MNERIEKTQMFPGQTRIGTGAVETYLTNYICLV